MSYSSVFLLFKKALSFVAGSAHCHNLKSFSMTAEQFDGLSEIEKVSAILQYGRLTAQSADSDSKIFLYRMESFYVTAAYRGSDDRLVEITCFTSKSELSPHFRKHTDGVNPAEREYNRPE